ncbi:pentapeptide repeat-containing protein [Calothrix sp. PCC 6303]|uniref:pentapeptide repeat-containing protein n=1 Tax=Calothrix sp. PCC 6303 TaxID=1170562 RepID=UPI0002A00B03|nr:pentapeptide repeat-containing protein [Calothrix sp. PCC 6303]AFZ00797.1 pentapeptide repeat protein [Calothrix sp. PCC 6303]
MYNNSTQILHQTAINFLEQNQLKRLEILKKYGIARYTFLTKMSCNQTNIVCVMRYLQNPQFVKFPNLVDADLSNLVLDEANFIRGNLTGANLENTSLVNADLIFANLTNANLQNTNLSGATLNETIWQGALVKGCNFTNTSGLSDVQRKDLQNSGGIFDNLADDI